MALDLYDFEMAKVASVWAECNHLAMSTRNTVPAVKDLGMRIQDKFLNAGFLVNVDMTPCLILQPDGRTKSPVIEIIGRVDDPFSEQETDHDKKRFEILDANAKGEKFRGEKVAVDKPKKG